MTRGLLRKDMTGRKGKENTKLKETNGRRRRRRLCLLL